MLSKLLEVWEVNDTFPTEGVDAIAVVSYAAHNTLTHGSRQIIMIGMNYHQRNPNTIIGWGVFAGTTQEIERREKESIFKNAPNIYVGAVTSSTDECEAILQAWQKTGRHINKVGVGAEGAHSRRDRLVWQYYLPKYFPNAKLYFCSVNTQHCADNLNPIYLQRYWQVWLCFNVCFYPLYRWFPGVAWFAKHNFHQVSS